MMMPPGGPLPSTDSQSEWNAARPETLPRPTYWPAVLALGIAALAFGVVTTIIIGGVGLVLCALAIGGWIAELRRE